MAQLTNRMISIFGLLGVIWLTAMSGAHAQERPNVENLLQELADPDNEQWEKSEDAIVSEWSKSGSIAMDLLLERGKDALNEENYRLALEHFTAATDHAPQFAEAWNMRATTFFLMDEYGLAIEDISRTLALNPRHFGALHGLGIILEQLGDLKNALVAYRAAFAINPHRENLGEAVQRLSEIVDGKPA